jgi:hypothetical protein
MKRVQYVVWIHHLLYIHVHTLEPLNSLSTFLPCGGLTAEASGYINLSNGDLRTQGSQVLNLVSLDKLQTIG